MLLLSCSDRAYIAKFSNVKFSSTYKPVIPFRIDGYYMLETELIDSTLPKTQKYVFQDDGSYGELFISCKAGEKVNLSEKVKLQKAIIDIGGIFRVSNDTLYVTSYCRYYWTYNIVELKFKIEDNETLRKFEVVFTDLNPKDSIVKRVNEKYVFIPTDSMPNIELRYLKKKKWIWADKTEWLKYMKNRDS